MWIIREILRDCRQHGWGRKKWWADALGVPPLTVSHWFANRQKPDGPHTSRIMQVLQQRQKDERVGKLAEQLWQLYSDGDSPPQVMFPLIVEDMLAATILDTRTLALLSLWVERVRISWQAPPSEAIGNRLGWFMEISSQKPQWQPNRHTSMQRIFASTHTGKSADIYWRRFQTRVGRKWKVWDCSLAEIKKSLSVSM